MSKNATAQNDVTIAHHGRKVIYTIPARCVQFPHELFEQIVKLIPLAYAGVTLELGVEPGYTAAIVGVTFPANISGRQQSQILSLIRGYIEDCATGEVRYV